MKSHLISPSSIQSALIIGAGRLAWSLIPAMQDAGLEVQGIISRNSVEALRFSDTYCINSYSKFSDSPSADLVILTVPDSAIETVAIEICPSLEPGQILVHSSGSIGLEALGGFASTGVLYPMQAFTKESAISFKNPDLPLFVEGKNELVQNRLLDFARRLSGKAQILDSEARRKLHLGAVISCNFSNLMYRLTEELVPEVEFTVFESLIRNQLDLATSLGPAVAQTGPASRGDKQTLAIHLEMLRDRPEIREMYFQLSRLINPDVSDMEEV